MPGTTPRRTPEFIARAKALAAEGFLLSQIAVQLGTSRPTVKKALADVPVTATGGRLSYANRAEIMRLYREGLPKTQIARRVGFAETTVRDVIADAEQSAAASAAHREGGTNSLAGAAALPPNSVAVALASGRMPRPEIAAIVSKVISERHAREQAARIKAVRERAPVVRKFSGGPFRIGAHAENMQDGSR
jgi:DNA-binding CsgD family transcriptional regulator